MPKFMHPNEARLDTILMLDYLCKMHIKADTISLKKEMPEYLYSNLDITVICCLFCQGKQKFFNSCINNNDRLITFRASLINHMLSASQKPIG